MDPKTAYTLEIQRRYADVLNDLDPRVQTQVAASMSEAISLARDIGQEHGMQTLITGSLHLVGAALACLEL